MGRPKQDDIDVEIDVAMVRRYDLHPYQNKNTIEKRGRPRQRPQTNTEIGNMYLSDRASHDMPREDVPKSSSLSPLIQGNSHSPRPDHNDPELRMALEQDWLSQVPRRSLNNAAILSYEQSINGQIPTSDEYRGINVVHINEDIPNTSTFPSQDPVSCQQNGLQGFPTNIDNSVIPIDSQGSFLLGSKGSPATASSYIEQLEPPLIPDLQGPMNPYTSKEPKVVCPERSDQVEPLIRLLFRLQRWSKSWPPAFKDAATDNINIWTTPEIIGLFKASDFFIQILQGRDVRPQFPARRNLGTIFDVGVTAESGSSQCLGPDRTWSSPLPSPQLRPSLTPQDRMVVSLVKDCYDHFVYMFDILIEPILQHCQQMHVHSDVLNGSASSFRIHSSLEILDLNAVQKVASIFEQLDRAMHERASWLPYVEPSAQNRQPTYNQSQSGRSTYPRNSSGDKSSQTSSTIGFQYSVAFQTLKTDQNNCLNGLKSLDQRFRANLASLCRQLRVD
ncbi:hypothetical protein N7G274_010674 [Stereocaulon virgatum]|uniref:Uncharacterized protein n=1 Tax=Stereocaulon virgatum TaxID=373712 RepID=A0ABR3ZZS6_9LECA